MQGRIQTLLIFLTFFFIFLAPTRDTDFGWHYRCGQELINSGNLCRNNHYTVLLADYQWNSPSHGYDALLYLLYKYFGFPGVTVFYATSAALVFTFFIRALSNDRAWGLLLMLLGIWFSWEVLGLGFRSQIMSVYFLALFLVIIQLSQKNEKFLLTLPLLSLFWVNAHSGFFLGPLVLAFYLAKHLYEYLRGEITLKGLKLPAVTLGLTLLATSLNPFGIGVYQEVFRHSQVSMNTLIAEWLPPQPAQVLLIISAIVLTTALAVRKNPVDIFGILLVLFFGLLAASARRNLPLFSLAAVFAFSEITGKSSSWAAPGSDPSGSLHPQDDGVTGSRIRFDFAHGLSGIEGKSGMTKQIVTCLLLIFTSLIFAYKNAPAAGSYDEDDYARNALVPLPTDGVKFMQTQPPGNIFNAYEWGGYLIWKLPDFKIFTDGRMPSWDTIGENQLPQSWRGKSPYAVYIETIQTQPGWQEVLAGYNFQYIMIQSGAYLDLTLKEMGAKSGFTNIYDRDGVSIFKGIN